MTRALTQSNSFARITVLAGSRINGVRPNHLGRTEVDYCWGQGDLSARRVILSRLEQLKPDLVWFNLGASSFGRSPLTNLSGVLTPWFARRKGYPTTVTLHEVVELADLRALNAPGGALAPVGARLLTALATRADVVCLTMRHYVDWLAARGIDCAHIPIGAYHEPELLEESGLQELLFFTTLAPFKGLELLRDAFLSLLARYPQLVLTIAGTEHNRFPEYARNLKTSFSGMPRVRWLGQVSEDAVMELFRRASMVVLPYAASTGSSSVLYQAATWGRPVVASDLREIREMSVENDLQLQFFRSGDVESLQRAICALLDSPGLRCSQVRHNFAVIQRARPNQTSSRYVSAFNRALAKHGSAKLITFPEAELETP